MEDVDVAIIGGGPTGLAAGLYAARAQRRTVVWERGVLGGQIAITGTVENYPGFADGIEGPILALDMHRQAEQFGMETKYEGITRIAREPEGPHFLLDSPDGSYRAKVVIVAAGADPVKLSVPGEEEFTGKGVSYCATCDGAFFKGEVVAVVGGGDAAIEEALFLTRYASHVYVIHRRDELRASRHPPGARLRQRQDRIHLGHHRRLPFAGDADVDRRHPPTTSRPSDRTNPRGRRRLHLHRTPPQLRAHRRIRVRLDEGGHAFVNLWMETEQPGLYVAGDVRVDSARQLASAVGDGVTAAIRSEHYLQERFDGSDQAAHPPR